MSTSSFWAQEVIICDLCEKAALRFCNNCQVNLCMNCVSKHVHESDPISHDIVPFKLRIIQLVFPECDVHPTQRCEVHCQQCHKPVCIMCCIGQHKGHDAIELTKIVEAKKEEIKKEAEGIEAELIPKYLAADTDTELKISKMTQEFAKRKEEIKELRKIWHQEVDNIFDKADKLISSMESRSLGSLSGHQTKIKAKITRMKQIVKEQQEMLKSNRAKEINGFRSKSREHESEEIPKAIEIKVPSLIADTVQGGELRMEIDTLRAKLSQSSAASLSNDVSKVIATIPSDFNPLFRVVCVGLAEAWISGDNETITRVDTNGFEKDTVNIIGNDRPNDIAVTIQRELIYSGRSSKTVKIARQGMIHTLITPPQGWIPGGLCCTRSGDILVNLNNRNENKILRYQGSKVTQEIGKFEHGKPIFEEGERFLLLTENNNEDICVSDLNASKMVVVDRTGGVRFRYDGTSTRRKGSFGPRCIVTDSLGQIIVTDYINDCLHILDRDGTLLECVQSCGLDKPFGLSVDSEGRLWVGLWNTGEIKLVQYLK